MGFAVGGCATVHSRWTAADSLHTIEAYEEFLAEHPHSEYAATAKEKLYHLRYEKALAESSIAALEAFIGRYPASALADSARTEVETLVEQQTHTAYRLVAQQPSIAALEMFIEQHTGHALADSAESLLEPLLLGAARDAHTIDAYVTFLQRYPDGELAETARSSLLGILREVGTVPVVVDQAYSYRRHAALDPKGGTIDDFSLPIEATLEKLWNHTGVRLADSQDEPHDVVLEVRIRGSALSLVYLGPGTLYTGATLNGSLILKTAGYVVYEQSFRGTKWPPYRFKDASGLPLGYRQPHDAPFDDVLCTSFAFLQLGLC